MHSNQTSTNPSIKHKRAQRALRLLRYGAMLLLILTPAIVAMGLLYHFQGVGMSRLLPIWSDEILYWHQAQSFSVAGFNSGYYTVAGVTAPLGTPYYTWGVFIPALYGGWAALFGWGLASIPMINLLVLTLSLVFLVIVTRPTSVQSLTLFALLATFSPFIIWSPSSLMAVLQLGLAVGLAVGFWVLLRSGAGTPRRVLIALLLGIALASLVRVWWAMLYLPVLLLVLPSWRWWRVLLMGLVSAVLMLALAVLTYGMMAPFPNWLSDVFASENSRTLLENIRNNLKHFRQGNILEITLRWQVLSVMAALAASFPLILWLALRAGRALRPLIAEFGVYAYMLLGGWAFVMIVYETFEWRDFRILAPLLLMVLVLLALRGRYWVVLGVVASMLWLMPETLIVYDLWSGWHTDTEKHNAYFAWENELDKVLQYEPNAPSQWCNTLWHTMHYLFVPTSTLLAVDAGIGLTSPLFLDDYAVPSRSRYLMLDDRTYEQIAPDVDVSLLRAVPDGGLYLNHAAMC